MNGLRSDGFLVHTLIGVVMEYLHFQVVNHVYIYGHLGELSNVNENKYEGCWREQFKKRFQNVIDVICCCVSL